MKALACTFLAVVVFALGFHQIDSGTFKPGKLPKEEVALLKPSAKSLGDPLHHLVLTLPRGVRECHEHRHEADDEDQNRKDAAVAHELL